MTLLAWLMVPVIAWAAWRNLCRAGWVLLALAGCVPLGQDDRLDVMAREEWTRVGAPDRFASLLVSGQACVGFPGVLGRTAFVPWPWSEWDWMARVIMRYELSKIAWESHGFDRDGSPRWYAPFTLLDGWLHLPPSEMHSWWRVIAPDEIVR